MNERIKQLSKQAEIYALTLVDREDDYVEVFEQKFAELIVQECIGCADVVGKANYVSSYPNSTAHHIKQKIKEHFGVQE